MFRDRISWSEYYLNIKFVDFKPPNSEPLLIAGNVFVVKLSVGF